MKNHDLNKRENESFTDDSFVLLSSYVQKNLYAVNINKKLS